jgi:hypothetical protein
MSITEKDINEYIAIIMDKLPEIQGQERYIVEYKLLNLIKAYPELALHYPIETYVDAIRGIE